MNKQYVYIVKLGVETYQTATFKAYLQSSLDKIYYQSRSKDSAHAWETKLIRHAEERILRFYPLKAVNSPSPFVLKRIKK